MPKTLLLADDSVTIQKVVGISFANEDVVLLTVDNGDDAVRRASEARPDIVLADVVMPGKNGYEVCEAIKADPALASTPVLLLTGTFEAFDEDRALRAGADGHITKPFEAQALVDQVNTLLARSSGAPPPARTEPMPLELEVPASPSADTAYDFFDEEITEPGADDGQDASDATVLVSAPPPSPEAFGFERGDDLHEEAPREARPTTPLPPAPAHEPRDEGETVAYLGADPIGAEAAPSLELDTDDSSGRGWDREDALSVDDPFEAQPPVASAPIARDPQAQSAARLFDDPAPPVAPSPDPHGETRIISADEMPERVANFVPDAPEPSRDPWAPAAHAGGAADPFAIAPEAPTWATPAEPDPILDEEPMERPFSVAGTPAPSPWDAPEPAAAPWASTSAVEVEETMGDAMLDPASGRDDYDVSSSDLGSPFAAPARPAPGIEPTAHARGPETPATPLSAELRGEVRDAIEKIAWEAFGQLTEQLVKEAVARVEQVAWEVVPQMTEAVLREEIRKLKGGSDS